MLMVVVVVCRTGGPGPVPVGGRVVQGEQAAVDGPGPAESRPAQPGGSTRVGEQDHHQRHQDLPAPVARTAHVLPLPHGLHRRRQCVPFSFLFIFFFDRRAPAVVDRRLFHRSVTLVGGKEEKRTEIQLGHWPFSLLLLLLFCRARTAAPAVQRRPRPGPPAARRPLPHARHPRGPPQKVLPPSCRCFVPIEFSFFFAKFHWPHLSLIGFYGEETSFNQFFLITGFWRH